MVGRQSKATVVAVILLVGLAVAPGFALAVATDDAVSGVVGQDDAAIGPANGALAQDDGANTTLDNLSIETLTLENVTIRNAMIAQATVNGEERSNLTASSVTVENATLTNVSFHNVTLTDREMVALVVGGARATPEQNNTVESLDVSDRTIDGLLIREATVQNASDVQLGETGGDAADGETGQAGQLSAAEASVIIDNVTVESISQGATDEVGSENGTDTETEVEAGDDGSSDETETEADE